MKKILILYILFGLIACKKQSLQIAPEINNNVKLNPSEEEFVGTWQNTQNTKYFYDANKRGPNSSSGAINLIDTIFIYPNHTYKAVRRLHHPMAGSWKVDNDKLDFESGFENKPFFVNFPLGFSNENEFFLETDFMYGRIECGNDTTGAFVEYYCKDKHVFQLVKDKSN